MIHVDHLSRRHGARVGFRAPVQVPEEPSDFADGIRAALTALAHADPALVPYLRRTLLEGGPSAEVMFDG
jgi:hypothetical protein